MKLNEELIESMVLISGLPEEVLLRSLKAYELAALNKVYSDVMSVGDVEVQDEYDFGLFLVNCEDLANPQVTITESVTEKFSNTVLKGADYLGAEVADKFFSELVENYDGSPIITTGGVD